MGEMGESCIHQPQNGRRKCSVGSQVVGEGEEIDKAVNKQGRQRGKDNGQYRQQESMGGDRKARKLHLPPGSTGSEGDMGLRQRHVE